MSHFKDLFDKAMTAEPVAKPVSGSQRWDIFDSQPPAPTKPQQPSTFVCPFAGEDQLSAALKRIGDTVSRIAEQQEALNLKVINLVSDWDAVTSRYRTVLAEIEALDKRVDAVVNPPPKTGWFRKAAASEDVSTVMEDVQKFVRKANPSHDPFLCQMIDDALTQSKGNERGAANAVTELGKFTSDPATEEGDRLDRLTIRAETLRSICRMTCTQLENMNKTLEGQLDELKVVRGITIPVLVMRLSSRTPNNQ